MNTDTAILLLLADRQKEIESLRAQVRQLEAVIIEGQGSDQG